MPRNLTYTDKQLVSAVAENSSIAGVLRSLGIRQAGGSHSHMSRRIKALGLDTSHFVGQGHNAGKHRPRLNASQILIEVPPNSPRRKPSLLRRALLEIGVSYECRDCELKPIWRERPLVLHVDHIDGRYWNCQPENLRFLCPNCHSQTSTYCRKGRLQRESSVA